MLFLSTSDFGGFFIIAIDFFNLCGSASACIGAWTLGRPLRAIATEMSLFLASETLACFHELCSLICPRLLWAVKMCILQFSSNSGTFRYSGLKPDHPILLDTHPTCPNLLRSAPGSHAAPAFPRILRTALPAPSPPVSGQSGLGYYAFLVSPLFLD